MRAHKAAKVTVSAMTPHDATAAVPPQVRGAFPDADQQAPYLVRPRPQAPRVLPPPVVRDLPGLRTPGTTGSGPLAACGSCLFFATGPKGDILVVDPYMDETLLTEFGKAVPEGCSLRLLADEKAGKPSLLTAASRWTKQYGPKRPLQVRLALPRVLHDRAIFIDGSVAWTLSQSIKDFAKRSPAEIIRADDVAAMKIAAYEAIWSASKDAMTP